MEPSTSATSFDIGPTMAVVGLNGWQCYICNACFQRSFSIEHHMITTHQSLYQQQQTSADQSVSSTPQQSQTAQSLCTAGDAKDGDSQKQPEVNNEIMVASSTAVLDTNKEGMVSVNLETCKNTKTQEDTASFVKEEPIYENVSVSCHQLVNTKEGNNSIVEKNTDEDLPVYFPAKFERQSLSCPNPCSYTDIFHNSPRSQDTPDTCVKTRPSYVLIDDHVADCGPRKASKALSWKPVKRRICSCGKIFERKQDFRHHRRNTHCRMHKKIFICPICSAQFGYKRGLNRHLSAKGSLVLSCSSCPRRFHDESSLALHEANCHRTPEPDTSPVTDLHHQGKDPWECSKCKKQFLTKNNFRQHLHECGILTFENGKRTFSCNFCSTKFQYLVDFHRHYVIDHKIVDLAQPNRIRSPAQLDISRFPCNSRDPSPCPSATSEINCAMAGVDLNNSNVLSTANTLTSSPVVNFVDLTTDQEVKEPSKNDQSFASGFSEDIIILSDSEDSSYSNSSSDNGSECELISSQSEEKNQNHLMNQKQECQASDFQSLLRGRHYSRGIYLPHFGPSPHMRPPPPHFPRNFYHGPRGDWHFPSYQYGYHQNSGHHHEHHGHHRGHMFGGGRFCHDWRRPGPRPFFAHGGIGPPRWCWQPYANEESYDETKYTSSETPSSSATFPPSNVSSETRPTPGNCTTKVPDTDQQETDKPSIGKKGCENPNYYPYGPGHAVAWTENLKELIDAKKMKKSFKAIFSSCKAARATYICPDCLQPFSEEIELRQHSKENHPTSTGYVCFFCRQSSSDSLAFNEHVRQHFETFTQSAGEGHDQWSMHRDSRMRWLIKLLRKGRHPFWLHGSRFGQGRHTWGMDKDSDSSCGGRKEDFKECPYCQKKFRAKSRESFFERHVNSHHGVETFKFKCEVDSCGKTFLEKAKYLTHIATHSSSQAFVCHECGKSYQNKTSLTRHQRIHTGERPYKCSECGEDFLENRDLVRHQSVHTGQAAFQCQDCGQGFTLKASLLTHRRNKHPAQVSTTATVCPHCSQSFECSSLLVQHLKTCVKAQENAAAAESCKEECIEIQQESMELDSND